MALRNASNTGKRSSDVPAQMRDGVAGLHKIVGLPEALARLSGFPIRTLSTRAGIERASAEICARQPIPIESGLRLYIATAMPSEALQVFGLARRVMDENPGAGIFQTRLAKNENSLLARFVEEISLPLSLPSGTRTAWNTVAGVAKALGIHARDIRNGRDLSRHAARAVRRLKAGEKKAAMRIATLPRAYALDPGAAAVAYAHAPREHGAIAVTVEGASEATVWRYSALTGVRPLAPRPWHRDPEVNAVMARLGMAAITRDAACHVTASGSQEWVQAVLADHGAGYRAHIQRVDGRVDLVEVAGWGTWSALGAQEAAQIASIFGERVILKGHSLAISDLKELVDEEELGPVSAGPRFPELEALLADGKITQSEFTRFEYRVHGATRRKNDSAVLIFLAGLPKDTARLTRLIAPFRAWDAASNRRFPPGHQQLAAAVAASAHPDPGAMVRAVEGAPARALILAAALRGPWEVASEAVTSGASPRQTLQAYVDAVVGGQMPPAALKSLADWPLPSRHEISSPESYAEFADLAKLAAALWAGTPSRPPMSTGQLDALKGGLLQFGFKRPSVAVLGEMTWTDPVLTMAYADALRRERADVPGSTSLGPGLIDAIHFVDARLSNLGLSQAVRVSVRCTLLVPRGRMIPRLEQISEAWHRSVDRMVRDRHALVQELTNEEGTEEGRFAGLGPAEEYPNPLPGPIKVNGITITPLRGFHEIGREAEDMANCLLSYADEARVGNLYLFGLKSRAGRSTLGLRVDGDGSYLEVSVFQHRGSQYSQADAPPPSRHAKAVSRLVIGMNGEDGGLVGSDWRDRQSEARRAHALRAALRLSEQELSPARQQRLAALDLFQLDLFLNKKQRSLSLNDFRLWALDNFAPRNRHEEPY